MTLISNAAAAIVAAQAPAALATTLASVAFDRELLGRVPLQGALRKGWTSRDASADPVLAAAFDHDRMHADLVRTILVHTSEECGFAVATSTVLGEQDVECVVAWDGFALVTGSMFRAGWCDWNSLGGSGVQLAELLASMGRR